MPKKLYKVCVEYYAYVMAESETEAKTAVGDIQNDCYPELFAEEADFGENPADWSESIPFGGEEENKTVGEIFLEARNGEPWNQS